MESYAVLVVLQQKTAEGEKEAQWLKQFIPLTGFLEMLFKSLCLAHQHL